MRCSPSETLSSELCAADFLVSQTGRQVVPDTWSSCSKTSVTKTTVNTSDRALSP